MTGYPTTQERQIYWVLLLSFWVPVAAGVFSGVSEHMLNGKGQNGNRSSPLPMSSIIRPRAMIPK